MRKLAWLVVLLLVGCGKAPTGLQHNVVAVGPGQCPFGIPEAKKLVQINRRGYTILYDTDRKSAVVVCEKLTADQLKGHLPRPTTFHVDPAVEQYRHATPKDYENSGYDIGHLAPSADQTVDQQLKGNTFYLTNTLPQLPEFNRLVWKALETLVRHWAQKYGTVYVLTGPLGFSSKTIGPGELPVPKAFFKIVVLKHPQHGWQAIAFVLANKKYAEPYRWQVWVKPIRNIEQTLRVNFMPTLPTATANELEAKPGDVQQW